MRADVEVRQRRAAHAAAPAVLEKTAAGEKRRIQGNGSLWNSPAPGRASSSSLDASEVHGDLGIDDRIDGHDGILGAARERGR